MSSIAYRQPATRARLLHWMARAVFYAIAPALVCATPPAAVAFTDCERALISLPLNRVEQAVKIDADTLLAREVLGGAAEQRAYHRDRRYRRADDPNSRVIKRRLDRLWRVRVLRSVPPAALVVTHSLVDADNDRFHHQEESQANLPVRIRPLDRIVVCRNATHQIIEGSAEMVISVGRLPLAGRYRGSILTDVRVP